MKALPQLEPDSRYLCKVITKLSESHTTVSSLGHTKLISCFWSYKSKNDQATRLFFFSEIEVEKKMVYKQQNGLWRVRSGGQDYKMQTIVYLRSQTIEAWMVKPLSV